MKIFTLVNHASVLAFPNQEAAVAAEQVDRGDELFWTLTGLENISNDLTMKELAAVWNGIAGVKPIAKFENRAKAARRIWEAVQTLPVQDGIPSRFTEASDWEKAEEEAAAIGVPPVASVVVAGEITPTTNGFHITHTIDPFTGEAYTDEENPMKQKKSARKAAAAPKGTVTITPAGVRSGTKQAQVVALLQRKGGASIVEIMSKMGWQRHTVRGWVATTPKKLGLQVESFRPEGGERTYRIVS